MEALWMSRQAMMAWPGVVAGTTGLAEGPSLCIWFRFFFYTIRLRTLGHWTFPSITGGAHSMLVIWAFFLLAPSLPRPGPQILLSKGRSSPSYCYCPPTGPGFDCVPLQRLTYQCPHPPALRAVHKPLCNPGGQVLTPLPQVRFASRERPRESRSAGLDMF